MKKFLLGTMTGLALAILLALIVAYAVTRPPGVPDGSVLVLPISGSVPEAPSAEVPFFEQMSPLTVRDYWQLLRSAASDSRIRAVVLMPQGVDIGWGRLEELRQGLARFRASGKPLVALLRVPAAREYYLATAADHIYMTPEDLLDLKGLRAELMFVKGTLDKLGVRVEVEHAGRYKDAPDMFTRTSMSPETREVVNSVLDGTFGQITSVIATARKKYPAEIRATMDRGPFTSEQALRTGLVDSLRYQDQVFGELSRRLGAGNPSRVSARDYLRATPAKGTRVAFVVAEGDMIRGGLGPLPVEGFASSAELTRVLHRVGDDSNIRGVIVRIDSPGGDAFASDEILREMRLLSRKKPTVISMSDSAASGGYYMAMTGDPVIAYPGTYTGSIGVYYGKVDLRGLYGKLGIEKQILTRGQFADIDSDYVPLSEAARAKLRKGVDSFYGRFIDQVAEGRRRPAAQIAPLAEGRVWLGTQAAENGLIDGLGGIDRAIEIVRQRARIPSSEPVRLVSFPPRRSLLEQVLGRSPDAFAGVPVLTTLRRYHTQAWMRGGFFQLMPYSIDVR